MRLVGKLMFIAVLLLAVATTLLAGGLYLGLVPTFGDRSTASLINALESGRLKAGQLFPTPDFGEPWSEEMLYDSYYHMLSGVLVYRSPYAVVLIYIDDARYLIGACAIQSGSVYDEKWYCCDDNKMLRHISKSIENKRGKPLGTP